MASCFSTLLASCISHEQQLTVDAFSVTFFSNFFFTILTFLHVHCLGRPNLRGTGACSLLCHDEKMCQIAKEQCQSKSLYASNVFLVMYKLIDFRGSFAIWHFFGMTQR